MEDGYTKKQGVKRKKTIVCQTTRNNSTYLDALLDKTKNKNLLKYTFDRISYPIRMVLTSRVGKDKIRPVENKKHIRMVHIHGLVWLSLGSVARGWCYPLHSGSTHILAKGVHDGFSLPWN